MSRLGGQLLALGVVALLLGWQRQSFLLLAVGLAMLGFGAGLVGGS